jgi:hypothetical protein
MTGGGIHVMGTLFKNLRKHSRQLKLRDGGISGLKSRFLQYFELIVHFQYKLEHLTFVPNRARRLLPQNVRPPRSR